MQDPTLPKSALVKSFFNVKIGSNFHKDFFLAQNSWVGQQVLLFDFVEKVYFQITLFAKNVPNFCRITA